MLIFNGFESHIHIELIEYCLDHKILTFCLPAHTLHVLQPLDVGVFAALKKYYKQEVNRLSYAIDKNEFPNLLARARQKAFSIQNIAAGFRATGTWPYNPIVVLQHLRLPEPELVKLVPPLPISARLQTPYDLITFRIATPKTPRSLLFAYQEMISTFDSNSLRTQKQKYLVGQLKKAVEENGAESVMHKAGEDHLRKQALVQKGKADTRHVNSHSACILERGSVLAELKRKRDEKEAEDIAKRQRKEDEKEIREEAKRKKEEEKLQKAEERKRKSEEKEREKLRKAEERQRKVAEREATKSRRARK